MTKKKLTEILKNQTITNQFDFTGSCPDADGVAQTFTIFNTTFFLSELKHNFFNRVMFVDPDSAFSDLVNTFQVWANNRGYMYARLAYAYSLGYNPIENYNSIEEHTGHDDFDNKKKVTRTWQNDKLERTYTNDKVERTYSSDKIERTYTNDKVERTYNNDEVETTYTNDKVERTYTNDAVETTHTNDKETTTYNSVKDDTEHKRLGVNSSTAVGVTEDINTKTGNMEVAKTGSTTETHTGSYADEHTGSTTDTHTGGYDDTHTGGYDDTHTGGYDDTHTGGYYDENSGKDSTIYNSQIAKHGNIGVSTASGMIGELFDGLKQNLALRAVHDFLDEFTFYDGEVDILW